MAAPGTRRVKTFTVRHPWVGPAVWVLSVLYFVAQIVVGWVWHPPYSAIRNTISDLGNTSCGRYGGAQVCSPRHVLMNAAFVLLGLIMATGALLIYQEFTERRRSERLAAAVGFGCLAVGGVGAVLVGAFPENTSHVAHMTGAGLAIGVGNVGILVLGLVLPLPESLRNFMVFFAPLSLAALVCFAFHRSFGIGPGTMERIAAYPETVWLIRFGIYISSSHSRRATPAALATAPPTATSADTSTAN